MLRRADTIGVFQIESRAQMSMLPRLKPENFYDLVIEVAIVRPGPIQGDMVHPYLRRRQGLETGRRTRRKELEAVLGKTLGVPLFQEQAMKIAIVAAGFTPGEADQLRRAMATFRRAGTIGTFQRKMIEGMVARGYPRDFAERCFSQIEGFGEYGFPESHAASFALLVYASAWLKCHYPDVFAAALLNAQPMGFYAPAQIVRDAREHGVEVRPVDVNHSRLGRHARAGPATRPSAPARAPPRHGGRHPHDACAAARLSPDQGLARGGREADRRERAARATTPSATSGCAPACRRASSSGSPTPTPSARSASPGGRRCGRPRRSAASATGDDDLPLFATGGARRRRRCVAREPDVALPPMPLGEQVVNDYRFLELSLKAHPVSFLRADLARRGIIRNEELRATPSGARVTVSGLVIVRQRPGSANGVIFMTIEDETAVANIIVWPKMFERFRPIVLGARYVAVSGELQQESGVIHVVAGRIDDLTPLLARLTEDAPPIEALARADAVKRPHDEDIDSRARGRRNPPRIAAPAELPDLLAERPRRAGARLGACALAPRRTSRCESANSSSE